MRPDVLSSQAFADAGVVGVFFRALTPPKYIVIRQPPINVH